MSADPYEPDGALRKCRYCGRHEPEHTATCQSRNQELGTVAEMRDAAASKGLEPGLATFDRWADELEAAIDAATDAQSDVANVVERNKELEGELETMQHEVFNLRAENESLKTGVRERDRIITCEDDRVNKVIKELDGLNAQLAAAERRISEYQNNNAYCDRVVMEQNARISDLESQIAAAPKAARGVPQFLCQEYTGKWHAFESRRDGEHFKRLPGEDHGYTRQSVSEWIWHPATRTEGAADGNSA